MESLDVLPRSFRTKAFQFEKKIFEESWKNIVVQKASNLDVLLPLRLRDPLRLSNRLFRVSSSLRILSISSGFLDSSSICESWLLDFWTQALSVFIVSLAKVSESKGCTEENETVLLEEAIGLAQE